jgi:hypothetical protein
MFVLDYQTPEKATADVAEIYDHFIQKRSPVPAPLQLMSTSPGLLKVFFDQIKYFMHHQALTFPLLAAIRFLAAQEVCFDHCTNLNRLWLTKTGLSEQDMADLAAGHKVEAFSEAENALLRTVAKVLRKEKIAESEVRHLHDLGWKDSDILDACAQGTNMIGTSRLFAAFSQQEAP